ncbi:MAG TPA: penicillin acylase family protein, partial [Burkholderiaceae bacterium]|nr:penicillin acylase family protein [Burkholderiaceae bacterium]
QRFDALVRTPDSPWFDDQRTPQRETLPDLIRRAATRVKTELSAQYGGDTSRWRWGDTHRIAFFSLLRPSGPERDAFGQAAQPMSGSGETLLRARTSFMSGDVEFFASMRFVADLGDPDRVQAVLSGGAIERQFHPNQKDQLAAWSAGRLLDWWLAPQKIDANAVTTQQLKPR